MIINLDIGFANIARSVMADETADVSNKEQVVVCIRWFDENLVANEKFIGLKCVQGANAETLIGTIKVN